MTNDTVLEFIQRLVTHPCKIRIDATSDTIMMDAIEVLFRQGYCWHFAHMLKTTFGCGEVCWAAPFGHFVYMYNGIPYDVEGVYQGEATYFIPESYIPEELLLDFKHIPDNTGKPGGATTEDLQDIMMKYCMDMGLIYDNSVMQYVIGSNVSNSVGNIVNIHIETEEEKG